ncbi:DNA-binding transcriptional regulator, GntR family [Devosia enhydra]|uniref:DNA-binding transcriptional regulator, GntR family n=1 Tax=Devosia enhydra TaxID=665118 RepID=A0A1K2HY70_9HYPH|nr:GntR family transcriptional regulator [Devosia enhydra]SFZ84586.1 DNA-binding transcriptional regulator, GntR family [Devosia enhydra]
MPTKAPKVSSKATTTTMVYDKIRADILAGRLEPGAKVRIEQLGQTYATSQSPIREALNRLASEGLVHREEQRGFFITPVSAEILRDLVDTRCWVEERALRQSIANRTPEWEEGLIVALHWLSRFPRYLNPEHTLLNPEWEKRHRIFHQSLISACGSPILLQLCQDLRDRSDRYRIIAETAQPVVLESRPDDHRAIADAALEGNADLAVDQLVRHYHRTLELIESHFLAPLSDARKPPSARSSPRARKASARKG